MQTTKPSIQTTRPSIQEHIYIVTKGEVVEVYDEGADEDFEFRISNTMKVRRRISNRDQCGAFENIALGSECWSDLLQ
jgi:hypothetical protein